MDFIIKASHLKVERYITRPQQLGKAPLRCFIAVDLVNMFNEILQDTIFKVIRERFPDLMPLVTVLYAQPEDVFFK